MSNNTKLPIKDILPIAQTLVERLRPFCQRIEIAGSLRRKRPMIGDIEIFAIRTGSSDFSKWLVTPVSWAGAMPIGMRQKDGYLWRGETRIDCPEESDLFTALGLSFIPLEDRDDGRWEKYKGK